MYCVSIGVIQRAAEATCNFNDTLSFMATYDSLRRQCRTLESLLDSKLTSYSRLAANIGREEDVEASGSSDRWKDLEEELDGLLEKVRRIEAFLHTYSANMSSTS